MAGILQVSILGPLGTPRRGVEKPEGPSALQPTTEVSILGPLLFNIYLNDIFFFVSDDNLTNYADDNTPNTTDLNTDVLIDNLVHDTSILIKWFNDNYF